MDRVTLDEQVGIALLVVLDSLTPSERTAWVLHDLFGVGFTDVADIVRRTPGAIRQLAARARRHVAGGRRRTVTEHDAAVAALTAASAAGDVAGLLRVFGPNVVLTSDGGGRVNAARRPVVDAERVAPFIFGIAGNGRE